ncbi:MAG: flagellar M-ring protein FliF [Desulfohalobiaceae bacterium]|nr:flagellar M-ring protein FliF [Desulfohalobiaceae bacterium]
MAQEARSTTNIIDRIRQWPRSRQISLALVALISLAAFAWIIFQAQQIPYKTLFANLSQKEASSVVQWLKKEGVSYKLADQGKTIRVPSNEVYSTRLKLAGAGLPKGQGVGLEIFDKQDFGVTKFTQQVNYQRALQGELARTISSLGPVENARIHLVMPEERLLREQQKKTKASVMLKTKRNRSLDQRQIGGIVHLVSGSIKGLEKDNVTVVDHRGQRLTENNEGLDSPMSPQKLKYKQKVQTQLEEKAQSLLDRVFGPGRALVRVTADLDFTRKQTTEEVFDTGNVVPRSEKEITQESGGRQVGGVPGAQSNLGGNETAFASAPSSRSEEVVNYEIGKEINEITKPIGGVEQLSVSVLVGESGQGGQEAQAASGVSQQQLDSVKTMVSSALGLSRDRGDRIEVVSMPFRKSVMEGKGVSASEDVGIQKYLPFAKYGAVLIGLILVYLFLVRPLIQTLQGEVREHYKTVQQLEDEQSPQPKIPSKDQPIEQLRSEISQSSISPSQVVKAWLKEG